VQALVKLPHHKAPENIWQNIEQELDREKGLQHLEGAITQYKTQIREANLPWEKIEQELENQDKLNRAINALPTYKPNKDIFEDIIEKTQKKKPQENIYLRYWIRGIAASIILLLGFFWLYDLPVSAEKIQVTYREETILQTDWQTVFSQFPEEDEVMQFITENCARLTQQCQAPEFKGLLDEYRELHATRQELINQLKTHREQTQLATYLVRIEKEKTEVGKKLIRHLLL
jgi:hypothetical protein